MERVGLIAGNGRFPLLFAQSARDLGIEVVAVAHEGETLPELTGLVASLTWIKVGELQRMIDAFRGAGIRQAVMAGGIRKATLLTSFAPDERGMAFLSRLDQFGDDAILRGVASELSRDGIAIVESTLFLRALLATSGVMTARPPTDAERADIDRGVAVARAIGRWDIGQSVVVKSGMVLAVEAIEGTDAALRRGAALGQGEVVAVKVSKPGQDLRFDVPAIGSDTVAVCAEVGVRVLAVEAGRTLMLDKERLLAAADAAAMTIVGVPPEEGG